jgi:hypothetical protein
MGEAVSELDRSLPQGSGGFLTAMFQYRVLLTKLRDGFKSNDTVDPGFIIAGVEPYYPIPADGKVPAEMSTLRVDCLVLRTRKGGETAKWYFSLTDNTLLGFESWYNKGEDPCEVYFHDYKEVNGVKMPHKMIVRYSDKSFATVSVRTYAMTKK